MHPDKSKFEASTICKQKQQSVIYRYTINQSFWFLPKTKLWQPRVSVVLVKECGCIKFREMFCVVTG